MTPNGLDWEGTTVSLSSRIPSGGPSQKEGAPVAVLATHQPSWRGATTPLLFRRGAMGVPPTGNRSTCLTPQLPLATTLSSGQFGCL